MMQMAMKQSRLNSCEVVDDCLILVSSFKPAKILKFGTSRPGAKFELSSP